MRIAGLLPWLWSKDCPLRRGERYLYLGLLAHSTGSGRVPFSLKELAKRLGFSHYWTCKLFARLRRFGLAYRRGRQIFVRTPADPPYWPNGDPRPPAEEPEKPPEISIVAPRRRRRRLRGER